MKVCFIAPADNYHIKKWCNWFVGRGHQVHIISFTDGSLDGVYIHKISTSIKPDSKDLDKIKYLFHSFEVRKLVQKIKPDIVNVHYATSYGTVAALSGLKGYVLSLWGSDIYDFPQKSIFHKELLKYSLNCAGYIFSTSKVMALEAKKYTKKNIEITPFGVDITLFNPDKKNRSYETDGIIRIGTVKALTPKYGIDVLIRAVGILSKNRKYLPIHLEIAGKGENEKQYKTLAQNLGIDNLIKWHGFVSQTTVAEIWANLDIAVIPSILESESFGVSAVEAQACGVPVIISDIPGLMEATKPGDTSIVVERGNAKELATQIENLINDSERRHKIGKRAREFVAQKYEIDYCFMNIEKLFGDILRGK